ncbi:MAG: AAA family ATPase [Firmicutes bacterium]|nr:AAA family ATPase [Bacillota bacterium]
MNTLLVGIAGGSSSGKTTFCRALQDHLGSDKVAVMGSDWYMNHGGPTHNRPDAVNEEEFLLDLDLLLKGKSISRRNRTVEHRSIVLIEGHLIFCFPRIVEKLDLKIFIDMDPEERLLRRISRNTLEAGMDLKGVIDWYRKDVQTNYWKFIEPTKKMADFIIWGDGDPKKVELLGAFLEKLAVEKAK